MNFLTILPMAFVMIAGPQILSAIFLATSDDWPRNSAAFVFGASLSITLIVTLAFLLLDNVKEGSTSDTAYWIVLVLLLAVMIHVYLKRGESEPPAWMGKLQNANPGFSFRLGFLLLGVFPTDILTSVAVGTYLAGHGDPWYHCLPFIGLTLLFLSTPALLLLGFGKRAEEFLPKARDWMNTHSWIVNEIVIVFFILITINSLTG